MKKVELVTEDSQLYNLNKVNKEGTWLIVTNETTHLKIDNIGLITDPYSGISNLYIKFVDSNCKAIYDKIYDLDSLSIEPQLEYDCLKNGKKIKMKVPLESEISEKLRKTQGYGQEPDYEMFIKLFENYIQTNDKMIKKNYENYDKDVLQARCDNYNITFSRKEEYYNKLINEI